MDCPFRIKRSVVRITPGVLKGCLPFETEDAPEGIFLLLPAFSAVKFGKFSNSDRDGPETLDAIEPPAISSPSHMSGARLSGARLTAAWLSGARLSCAKLSTANILGRSTRKPPFLDAWAFEKRQRTGS